MTKVGELPGRTVDRALGDVVFDRILKRDGDCDPQDDLKGDLRQYDAG
jgi:hypothetical protein